MAASKKLLVIEDNPVDARVFLHLISGPDWETLHAASLADARVLLDREGADAIDLVVVDLTLPDATGIEVVDFARVEVPGAACVILTGETLMTTALAALRHGASDYLVKGDLKRDAVQRALQLAMLRRDLVRQAEESERNMRAVLTAMRDALFVLDLAGRVLFRNGKADTLHVRFREDQPGDGARIEAVEGVVEQVSVRSVAGGEVPVEVRTRAIHWAGGRARLVVLRDLSAERRVQQANANLAEKEALAQVGDEAYKDWHDVKNKIHAMNGTLRYLDDLLSGRSAPDPRLPNPVGAMQGMVDEIHHIAEKYRKGAVQRRNLFEAFELSTLVDLKCTAFRSRMPDAGRLKVRIGAVPTIFGDHYDLGTALENLLTNSLKALGRRDDRGANGEIVVETLVEDGYALLRVTDNGPGFPPHVDVAQFLASGKTGSSDGTGIGLGSVRHTMARFQGDFNIQSVPGQGVSVRLRIPIPKPKDAAVREGKIRVLIVEDDELAAWSAQRLLRRRYEVTLAGDGQEAVDKLAEGETFDAVLCDLEMPNLDGPGFWRTVEQRWPELICRIAFCSGGASSPEMLAFLQEVSPTMLRKPFEEEEACVLIERLAETGL